jgi:flagellar basal-body rod modification protein FlgD
MPVSPVGSSTAPKSPAITTPTSGASSAKTGKPAGVDAGNGLDSNSFLQLLVTQLKYQNPSEPMDAAALMSSTAQLTMVDKINELITLQKADSKLTMASIAGSLVGKTVKYVDAKAGGAAVSGVVQGVSLAGDTLTLKVNNQDVDLATISEISTAA